MAIQPDRARDEESDGSTRISAMRPIALDERAPRSNVLVGSSPPMLEIQRQIECAAPSSATVLITGESGTGKEVVAAEIHQRSKRSTAPFVRVHCASLAESLLESELFGHERGAFTGALSRHEGRFERAHGGTLLLDEIGEIGPSVQVKLLRVLQERTIERVGGAEPIHVDVRIIAATHRDLRAAVDRGTFREDLYYRLNVIAIHVPPLRARASDILPLARFFLERFARENGKAVVGFTDAAQQRLLSSAWAGNVRELENAVEHAVVLADTALIDAEQLPPLEPTRFEQAFPAGMTLAEIERRAILATYEACAQSTAKTAQLLGISVRKVQYRLQEYGVLTARMESVRRGRAG